MATIAISADDFAKAHQLVRNWQRRQQPARLFLFPWHRKDQHSPMGDGPCTAYHQAASLY